MSAFSPRQMFTLDQACKPIDEAFGNVYLVGTAASRQDYRDVDVRCILADDTYDKLQDAIGLDAISFLSIAVGQHLEVATRLPIDFQFQREAEANDNHTGPRNPLGVRTLSNYRGDAAPKETNDE